MVFQPTLNVQRLAIASLLMMGLGTIPAFAQSSGTSTMNVKLSDVLELKINTANVDIEFATPADYNNGVTKPVPNQLTVTSNRPYDLKIKTSGSDLVNGQNLIPVSNISAQTTGTGLGTQSVVSALSTTDQTLATAVPPSMSKQISMQFSTAAGNSAFLKPSGDYTTTLTFTATAN
ncbi:hypothetical protein HNV11_10615 [Spirosoma taeanense]|uniref:CS1 type fimbrial major subunit n=1 Tax=Spirosoma taeanense TaxID=2735870 RepID=A0A6M5Y5Q8_9BACT|nr:hypothetical protein [Spirosoma taeanense]QJW89797.1 hypothetical protein HNV11_10615 [Spirosoma taeanense]